VRLREFLTYVTSETLQGQPEKVSEQQIGCSVFERQPGYSSSEDNIVRVHARQLRSRLEEYFLTEGRNEPVVLEIPKGSYVPVFQDRLVLQPPIVPEPIHAEPAAVEKRTRWFARIPNSLAIGAVAFSAVLGIIVAAWASSGPSSGSTPWMLAAVLDPAETTTVVIADSGFGALRSKIGAKPPLVDYSEPGYPGGLIKPGTPPAEESWIRALTSRPYTSFTTLVMATQLAQLAERNHYRIQFRFAREMNSRDFAEGRFILIGSAIVTPWVSLFESQQAFPSDWDPVSNRSIFRNRSPRPGEAAVYMPNAPNAVPGEAFGSVTLLIERKQASRLGTRVLLIEGTNIESSEAAANFMLDARMSRDALRTAGGAVPRKAASSYRFEVMLRTKAVSGASRDTAVVATRYSVDQ
jgi:hypothetical protein